MKRFAIQPGDDKAAQCEYVLPTPGINHAGTQRIVTGNNGEMYYTPDHYETFVQL